MDYEYVSYSSPSKIEIRIKLINHLILTLTNAQKINKYDIHLKLNDIKMIM